MIHSGQNLTSFSPEGIILAIFTVSEGTQLKKEIIQRLLLILLMMAVLVYTIFNYMSQGIDTPYFMIILAFMSYVLISNVAQLVRDLRDQH